MKASMAVLVKLIPPCSTVAFPGLDRKDLGEKPKGQERKEYRFSVGEETVTRLKYLPLAMMLLSVVGLGGAIWIVRRR